MRDIVKRKRDEHLKMVWRVNFAHKRLQSRIEHMRKFRRQHEQLRTVIVRVLRPSSSSSSASANAMTQSTIEQTEQGCNSIDTLNFGHKTGHKTGPNLILGNYECTGPEIITCYGLRETG